VVTSTSDTLLFQPKADAPAIQIATPNIVKLEVAGPQKTHKACGALIGFLIGAGAGAILGAATYKKDQCAGICVVPDARSFDATLGAVLLGVPGMAHMPGGIVRAVAGLGDARHRERGDGGEGEKSLDGPVAHGGGVPSGGLVSGECWGGQNDAPRPVGITIGPL